ncbi:retrograde regulation protein 2 [Exophiala viscosa]|uniref:retrograde regulation protein 2 n=1 Tax=Exophiala viscosa TaxID=2486360 RepID=UPI0021926566|nr:retrograde regulation protein 2 [Exophiala viscosa]
MDIKHVNEKDASGIAAPDAIHSPASNSSDEKPTVMTAENVQTDPHDHNDINKPYDPALAPQYTKKEEDAVIRKLDWHLMPLIFVLYSLSVLDRSNLGNARISGMEKDIDLTGNRYDWLGTAFYISYILFQWTQMGWKAFPPHKWVAFVVFGWGVVSTLQAACTSWAGVMVCRVILAIFEASYGPGVPLYLSFFYPREKLGLRTGIFLSGSAAANAYGSALAYGIAQAKSSIGPWRILFIVEGAPTCVLAIVAWFWLPDSPHAAKFLNARDKEIAIDLSLRQPGDRTGSKGLQWKQVLGGLMDYRSYLPPIMYFGCNVCFASLPLFVPTIISEMGAFTSIQSNGLSAPPYVLCFLAICGTAFISDRVGYRGPFVALPALFAAVGYIILGTTTGVGPRYFGLFLAVLIFVSVAMTLTWVGNTHATDSKRAVALAILATGGQCGPVLGTNIFPKSDAPYYRKGMWISCGACLITVVAACMQMGLLIRANKKRDEKYGANRDTVHLERPTEFGEDKQFRYMV